MSYARRTDKEHASVLAAIRAMGLPCMSLHASGGGLEDIIVGVPARRMGAELKLWVMVEVKTVETKSTGYVRYTSAQQKWYALTDGYPRITVTSAQDAVGKLRSLGCLSE